ncbi:MAG: tetratricopeptide repeat protein [Chloroflexi bacterium]|nr:tetratricopeptide repeat protein [Chloroflexota bacterium]
MKKLQGCLSLSLLILLFVGIQYVGEWILSFIWPTVSKQIVETLQALIAVPIFFWLVFKPENISPTSFIRRYKGQVFSVVIFIAICLSLIFLAFDLAFEWIKNNFQNPFVVLVGIFLAGLFISTVISTGLFMLYLLIPDGIGLYYLAQGRYQRALWWVRLMQKSHMAAELFYNLEGTILVYAGDVDTAVSFMQPFTQSNSLIHFQTWAVYGWALLQQGQVDTAIQALEKSISIKPTEQAYLYLAEANL